MVYYVSASRNIYSFFDEWWKKIKYYDIHTYNKYALERQPLYGCLKCELIFKYVSSTKVAIQFHVPTKIVKMYLTVT